MEISFLPDGTMKAIWDDSSGFDPRRVLGKPRRASRIEVIEGGPHDGEFSVDMSLLGGITGNPAHFVCLLPTYRSYQAANQAEIAWLKQNWVAALPEEAADG